VIVVKPAHLKAARNLVRRSIGAHALKDPNSKAFVVSIAGWLAKGAVVRLTKTAKHQWKLSLQKPFR
jgi:hypothetical protein